jgi:UDP-GlcNAc:undecaprenyl-phosphate GlcNAc-1-phosphate transferase
MNQTLPAAPSMTDIIAPHMGVFFVALVVTLVATPLLRRLAIANGVVDVPDKRKAHAEPIAYLGGISLFLGWLGGVLLCYLVVPSSGEVEFPRAVIIGAVIIAVTGLIDDVWRLPPHVKIGGQLLTTAALIFQSNIGQTLAGNLFAAAHMPLSPEFGQVSYWLGACIITFFVIGGCNSVNLLDGLDGLAAGVCGIAALGLLFLAAYTASDPALASESDPTRIVMCLALLGAVAGFLPYNFNPANIFMGDAGSMLLGYLCVSTILQFALVPNHGPLLVLAGLVVFALPITDTTLAIFRRKMRGQPIFSPDNQHLHHLFLRWAQRFRLGRPASVKVAVLAMYFLAALFAVLGGTLIVVFTRWRYILAIVAALFSFIVVTAYKAGHRHALIKPDEYPPAEAPAVNDTSSPP